MTTMVEVDEELAALLGEESRRTGETVPHLVGRLLRSHLPPTASREHTAPDLGGFLDLRLPAEWTSHKVEDLLDLLEGPDRKW